MESTEAQAIDSQKIREAYIEYVLHEGKQPPSVFTFAKSLGISESEFYEHYNSFNGIEQAIWLLSFEQTKSKIEADGNYDSFSVREKLLAFYYTLFEELKNQRSFILKAFEEVQKTNINPSFLTTFKEHFDAFIAAQLNEGKESQEVQDRPVISKNYDKAFWLQFIYLLRFWVSDESPKFEKTDMAIEKSVNLSFDLIGKGAIDSILDFGKFLFQNRK